MLSSSWKSVMDEEMSPLHQNQTWKFSSLHDGKQTVGCRWVYTDKYHPNSLIERLKARLVAKEYTQIYSVNYMNSLPWLG